MVSRPLFRSIVVTLVAYTAGAAWLWLDTALTEIARPERLTNRILIAFLLPTTAAAVLWLFHAFESRRPVCAHEPGDLAATIFHLMGIGPDEEFRDAQGRPYRICQGQPIRPLVGGT